MPHPCGVGLCHSAPPRRISGMNGGSWVTPPLLFRFPIIDRWLLLFPFSVIPPALSGARFLRPVCFTGTEGTGGPRLLRAVVEGPWQDLNATSTNGTTTTQSRPPSKIPPRPPIRHARIPHPVRRPILMRIPFPRPLQQSSNRVEQSFHQPCLRARILA